MVTKKQKIGRTKKTLGLTIEICSQFGKIEFLVSSWFSAKTVKKSWNFQFEMNVQKTLNEENNSHNKENSSISGKKKIPNWEKREMKSAML